jgi:hypothetical protein
MTIKDKIQVYLLKKLLKVDNKFISEFSYRIQRCESDDFDTIANYIVSIIKLSIRGSKCLNSIYETHKDKMLYSKTSEKYGVKITSTIKDRVKK